MALDPLSTRRDTRHLVRPGTCFVALEPPEPNKARSWVALIQMSVCGLSFELDGDAPEIVSGQCLEGLTVRIGQCLVQGDALVRSTASRGASGLEVGCLFYPASPDDQERWMAVIAGLEAALPRD